MIDKDTMHILIADDVENMRRSLHGLLKVLEYGSEFSYAANGIEALRCLRRERIDLALLDLNMPLMDGVEVLATIREDRDLRDLPVVIISGEARKEIVAQAAESDLNAYIIKPVTAMALGDRIEHILRAVNTPSPMVRHLRQARELEENDDLNGAISEVRLAMDTNPESSRPLRELGYLLSKQKAYKEAKKCLLRATAMNPLDVFACHHLAELYEQLGNLENAARFYERAMEISPRHVDRGLAYGKVLVRQGHESQAREVFASILRHADHPDTVREEVADFCLENDCPSYSITLFNELARANPADPSASVKLGQAYAALGDYESAARHLERAGELGDNSPERKLHMARNYLALGWTMHAERVLKEVLTDDPQQEEARELVTQHHISI